MTPWASYGTPTAPPIGFVLIPSGKHAAFRDWDAASLAKCTPAYWGTSGCARCDHDDYARNSSKHRADVTQ